MSDKSTSIVETCPICLDTINDTNFCVTECKHSFCLTCLHTSLLNKESCPLCRGDLVPKNNDRADLARTRKQNHHLEHDNFKLYECCEHLQEHLQEQCVINSDLNRQRLKSLDTRDSFLDEIYKAIGTLSPLGQKKVMGIIEGPCSTKRLDYKRECPWLTHGLKISQDNKPCYICGCNSELDDYGDRKCFCDSCHSLGCFAERNKWKREWKMRNRHVLIRRRVAKV